MPDIKQPKWNFTQVASNVGDISHLGRNSQENKLPENIARQTTPRQELRRQESRRPSQNNELQEIKPTIERPILNPSIQSTSDPGPPSDQIFRHQDASTKLSTMKSVINPKEIQENLPREIRSNQGIPRQAVEFQKVDPQKVDPQKVGLQKVNTQKVGPQKIEKVDRQKVEPRNVEPQKVEPQNFDIQKVGPQKVGPQKVEHQKVDRQKAQPRNVEPQNVEPQNIDTQKVGPQKVEHQKVDRQRAQSRNVEPQKVEPRNVDTQKVGPQKVEHQKVDRQKAQLRNVEPQKVEPQNVDTQKVDRQKAEPRNIEPQKFDSEKADCQKVEGVDPGRHSLTPLYNLDYSPASSSLARLTTKTQENKSDRYTHDQGEYTTQYVHNNVPDQNPAKPNLLAKTTGSLISQLPISTNVRPYTRIEKPREYPPVEIKSEKEETELLQEVQPQDVVPMKLDQRALDSELSLSQPSFKLPEDKTGKYASFGSKSIQRIINKPSNQKTSSVKPASKSKKNSISSLLKGALAKQVKTEELSQDDVIIAVMGPTGSGKSTFIEIATEFDTGVGHNLESCTSEINIVKLSLPELADNDVVFVDTPGFDDTHKSDVEILTMVADWLKTTYEKEIKLSGLLYFHRISDNRMAGTPLKNLRMFEELCGKNALNNVILVTTMWDEVDEDAGNLRETELKSKYWRSMLEHGSTTSRFMHTRESALNLIESFVEAANAKNTLLLQQEMVDMRAKLPATSAGVRVFSDMEDLVKKRQEVLQQLRNAMKQTNKDHRSLTALQEEHQRLKTQLDQTVNEMRQLKLPLGKRLSRMTRKWFFFKFSF